MNKNGDPTGDAVRPLWRRYLPAALIGVVLIALTTALFPVSSMLPPLGTPEIGDVAAKDIVAPQTIAIKRTAEELDFDKERVLQTVPLVFEYDDGTADSVTREASQLLSALVVVGDGSREWERLALTFPHLAIPEALRHMSSGLRVKARAAVDTTLEHLYHFGLMRNRLELPASASQTAAIVHGDGEQIIQREHLLDIPEAQALLHTELREALSDSSARVAFYELARQWLVPNLELDVRATERRKEVALSAIPTNKGVILKDDYIIRAGERVTARHIEALRALAEVQATAERQGDPWKLWVPLLARVLFLAAIFVGFGVALQSAAPSVISNTRALLALGVLYAFEIALAYLIYFRWDVSSYLLPITVGTMLATILFSLGVGFSFAMFLALVLGVVSGFDFAPVFLAASAGVVASLAVRNVRQRYHFYRPILFLAVTYIIVISLLEALRFTPPGQILERAGYGALNGVLSPIVTIGLLPIFETSFRLTTDITLLELADMNHPLLRRLAVAAPGTYHHSIIVANLCEAAAEAVDANPLLARVGAYFHDIGKVEKPEYFVENQMGRRSKHDGLAPTMSALILSAHIKAGAEMARDARLPDVIIDFIEEHHGTTQMSYFYGKAKEQAGEDISDSDFKYPGPKPKSKETAILMLADSVEAVSRTLEDPRPNRLRGAIHQVITDKFMAGQLSDCPLTLADLSKIEDAFLHLLLGAFHGRVKYPQQEEEARRRKEEMFG